MESKNSMTEHTIRDEKWLANFEALKAHVAETGHFANKIGFVSPARRYEAPTVVLPPQM